VIDTIIFTSQWEPSPIGLAERAERAVVVVRDVDTRDTTTAIATSIERALALFQQASGPTRIVFVTPLGHPVGGALAAACRAVRRESPRLVASVLELAAHDERRVDAELASDDVHVRITDRREVAQLVELRLPRRDLPTPSRVLVTGGLGGLGLIVAEHLAGRGADVVLVGRRALDHDAAARVAAIGARYTICDVTDRIAVAALPSSFDVVVHAAGLTRDSYIAKKTAAELAEVIPPKTHAVEHLRRAFPHAHLVLFSSTSACFGNAGQLDYAFANGWMDALAERDARITAINWPLWRSGGMHVDAETERYMERTLGLVPLDTATGLAVLDAALATRGRIGVVTGRRERMLTALPIRACVEPITSDEATMGNATDNGGDIAIIGMACRFPGAADLDQLWRNLVAGVDSVSEVPSDRWDAAAIFGKPGKDQDKTLVRRAGFVDDIAEFDNDFFRLSPKEALYMDPQQRILLEAVWHCFEDAGLKPSTLAKRLVGTYIGASRHDYAEVLAQAGVANDFYLSTGSSHAVLVNRINYLFDLRGPSVAIDAACASSLVAIHEAAKALRAGECELALAGGVNALLTPTEFISLDKTGVLSRDGACKVFDQSANGYVRAEGVGCLLLKPLAAALRDGDRVHGVLKASLVNHDGKTPTFTSPSQEAQADLITRCYQRAGIDSKSVSYVETHGTGTVIGDPIEVMALKEAFAATASAGERASRCGLGSLKTNIGHMESAAGVGSVIKVLLAMRHRVLPRSLHLTKVNPFINLEGSPFEIVRENRPWEGAVVRAGVSSFGYGGANAHLVLESVAAPTRAEADGPVLLALSAPTKEALTRQARHWHDQLAARPDLDLAAVASATQAREVFRERLAIVASSVDEARAALAASLAGSEHAGVVRGSGELKAQLDALFADDDGAALVQALIATKSLRKLAVLWASGFAIAFETTRRHGDALPGYAFTRQRFWPERAARVVTKSDLALEVVSPSEVRVRLDGEAFFLADHRVLGHQTLPGVFFAELVRRAAVAALGWQGNTLTQLTIAAPVRVERATQLTVCFTRDARGHHVAVLEGGVEKASARLVDERRAPAAQSLAPAYARFRAAHPETEDKASRYRRLSAAGLVYGATFQGVERQHADQREAWSELALVASHHATLAEHVLHPTFLDGALQSSFGLLGDVDRPMVPVSFAEIRWHAALDARVLGHCRLTKRASKSASFDIALVSAAGAPLVELLGATLFALETPAPVAPVQESTGARKVAVIGTSCRVADARSPAELWELLRAGRETFREVTPDRWDPKRFFDPAMRSPDATYTKWASLVDDFDCFDYERFGFKSEEAATLDPQQRLVLESTQHLFEDAGYRNDEVAGTRCAFYLATGEERWNKLNLDRFSASQMRWFITSSIENLVAARVPDHFNLKGPCLTVDTACSSSLVAIDLAVESILNGGCELAIAGGVELIQDHFSTVGFAQMGVLSKEPRHYAFDKRAQGFVMGEGVGLVLLKDYERALADGDDIKAVILATAVNNDGKTMGIATPSLEGQKDVIALALAKAGVGADTISYVETHGTGTLMGDPMEVRALSQVYERHGSGKQHCAIGTIKANVGHLLRAAGVVGFIKTVLALRHRELPALINCEQPSTALKLETTPFFLNRELRAWTPIDGVRRAAISSFGFGGTNAHAILEEAPARHVPRRAPLALTRFKRMRCRLGQPVVEVVAAATSAPPPVASGADSGSAIHLLVAAELGFTTAELKRTTPFMELGIESTRFMKLVRLFDERFGIELYATVFYEKHNLDELIAHLQAEHAPALARMSLALPVAPALAAPTSVGPAAPDARGASIGETIHALVAGELGFTTAELKRTTPFMEMGVESTRFMKLVRVFDERFGVELYPTIFFEHANLDEFIAYLEVEHRAAFAALTPVASDAPTVAPALAAPPAAAPATVGDAVHALVARELGFTTSELQRETPFMEMGIESTRFMKLVRIFDERFGVELYPTIFFEHTNLAELIAHLEAEHGAALRSALGAVPAPSPAPSRKADYDAALERFVGWVQATHRVDLRALTTPTHTSELGIDSLSLIAFKLRFAREIGASTAVADLTWAETFHELARADATTCFGLDPAALDAPEYTFLKNLRFIDRRPPSPSADKFRRLLPRFTPADLRVVRGPDGAAVEVLVVGSGEPILLLPSVNTLGTSMFNQIEHLAARHQVIVPSYPGLGGSDALLPVDLDAVATRLVGVMDALIGRGSYAIAGWSLGGMLGQLVARRDERVHSLALISSGPCHPGDGADLARGLDLLWRLIGDFAKSEARYAHVGSLRDSFRGTHDLETMVGYFLAGDGFDGRAALRELRCPVLVLAGEDDYVFPLTLQRETVQALPLGRLEVIAGAAHLAPLTHPDAVNAALDRFLLVPMLDVTPSDHARSAA